MIIAMIVSGVINSKINPPEHHPFKYGYFLSVFAIIEAIYFFIWAIFDTFNNYYSKSGEKALSTIFIILVVFLLFTISILNGKKYKIGAILISIITGNFIICYFYYSKRWNEFKTTKELINNVKIRFNKTSIEEKDIINKNTTDINAGNENPFIGYLKNDKLFEEFIWAINKIGKPINGIITIDNLSIKIHPMILQYSLFVENGRHIENEVKNDIINILQQNLKENIILFSKLTGNDKFNYIVNDIEKMEKDVKRIEEKNNNLEDLFKDKSIVEEANEFRRIYGKGMLYISFLKNKAKELGLGDIEINADDIE
jgi:hypothetical protein